MGGEGSGECIAQPAGVHRRCVGERKCSARACRCAGAGEGFRRGMGCEVGGEGIAQPAGVRRGCVGERKCSGRACRCAGVSEELWRGMGGEVGGECIAQPAGVRRGCVGERKCSGRACRCAGVSEGLRREWVVRSAGRASHSLRACVGVAWTIGSAREGCVAVRGRAKVFGGEWVVRAAGLTHIRRSSTRARVFIYTSALSMP